MSTKVLLFCLELKLNDEYPTSQNKARELWSQYSTSPAKLSRKICPHFGNVLQPSVSSSTLKKKHLRMVGTISKYRRLVNTRKKQPERWKIAKHNKGSAKLIQLTVKRINKGNERNRPNWLPKIDKTETEKKTIPSNDEAHTHDLKRPHKKVRMDKPKKGKYQIQEKRKQSTNVRKSNKHKWSPNTTNTTN